ncbi:MAG: FAD-binding oxidoreductase [Burkholderiaceae bacterium]
MVTTPVQSWGRVGSWPHHLAPLPHGGGKVLPALEGRTGLAFGMGRSYGDVCLNPEGLLWLTRGMDRLIHWDEAAGRLNCEAGVLLRDIQRLMVPRGWMLPVTPGTQLVTVGGAIANDVHGKNHHRFGSFGDQLISLELLRTDGTRLRCSRDEHRELFLATLGGLGLTGVVLEATLHLRRVEGPWVDAEDLPFKGLDAFFELADASEAGWEHTVAWIDCLSGADVRGIFSRGNMSPEPADAGARGQRRRSMPVTPPVSLVNRLSLKAFNTAYYALGSRRAGRRRVHFEPFFYPLDSIEHWNRMYGPAGFYQYQCVLPRAAGRQGVAELLAEIGRSGQGSFLAVLKTFGDRPPCGLLSFPRPGVTLALDFPAQGAATHALFERLDRVVMAAGGTLYPAKDGRMPRAMFEQGYPAWQSFQALRDPGIDSAFARRMMGH